MGGVVRGIAELPGEPWRNGAGITRPVAADPDGSMGDGAAGDGAAGDGSAGDGASWRISIATVTDGAVFSSFPGYRRTFVPIGSGITLFDADGPIVAGADDVVTFDGAAAVRARVVDGEALALNVMTLAGWRARIERRTVTGPIAVRHPEARAIVMSGGSVTDSGGRTVYAPAIVALESIAPQSIAPQGVAPQSVPPRSPAAGMVVTPGTLTADDARLLDIFIDPAPIATKRTTG